MKKLLLLLSAALTAFTVSACGASAPAAQPAPQNTAAANGHKAVLVIDGSRLPVTLRNEPSANDLYSRLPVTLSFKDFSGMEKIAILTNALTKRGKRLAAIPLRAICAFISRGAI